MVILWLRRVRPSARACLGPMLLSLIVRAAALVLRPGLRSSSMAVSLKNSAPATGDL